MKIRQERKEAIRAVMEAARKEGETSTDCDIGAVQHEVGTIKIEDFEKGQGKDRNK